MPFEVRKTLPKIIPVEKPAVEEKPAEKPAEDYSWLKDSLEQAIKTKKTLDIEDKTRERNERLEAAVAALSDKMGEIESYLRRIAAKEYPRFPEIKIPDHPPFPSKMEMSNFKAADFSKLEEILLRIELSLNRKPEPQPPVVIRVPSEKTEEPKEEAGTGSVYGKRKAPHPLLRFPTGTAKGIADGTTAVFYFDRQPKWDVSAFLFLNGQAQVPDSGGQTNDFAWSGNQVTFHTQPTQGDQVFAWFYQ